MVWVWMCLPSSLGARERISSTNNRKECNLSQNSKEDYRGMGSRHEIWWSTWQSTRHCTVWRARRSPYTRHQTPIRPGHSEIAWKKHMFDFKVSPGEQPKKTNLTFEESKVGSFIWRKTTFHLWRDNLFFRRARLRAFLERILFLSISGKHFIYVELVKFIWFFQTVISKR